MEVYSDFIDDDYNNIDVDYKRNLWKDIFVFFRERERFITKNLWPFMAILTDVEKIAKTRKLI